MKAAPIALLALACALPIAASAQWMYLDKDGRKVFSDKAPPPDIAPERILKGPKGAVGTAAMTPGVQPVSAEAAPNAASSGGLKPLGKDNALQERKKQLAAQEAAKKKADDEKVASSRAENCGRAKQAKSAFDAGQRITRVDSKGERTYMDDNERAAEVKRLEQVIARDCAQ